MGYVIAFGYVMAVYILMIGITFVSCVKMDKDKNGGKNSPEAGFTYGIMSLVWPYFYCIVIGQHIKRFFR